MIDYINGLGRAEVLIVAECNVKAGYSLIF